MRRKVVIVLDDVVVALDLAQTLQDLDPAAHIVTYRSAEDAKEAAKGQDKASLIIWQPLSETPEENSAVLVQCDLAERSILLSDSAETVYDAAANVVVLPRPFSADMVKNAVSRVSADH
ncbi:hypothetical protein JQV27_16720 [Sulfitobacter mediterraneus]|jgi:hypothetical protein|uniref:hypothetical protein n=1 Tax=Sulfitobacter mediterraneus TaxID=83219 RepID=UPI0019340108|nr:hypothetical protein [Sulfitobacter mediterraneus]MBM1634497.1 hypothetical protein [Sulfitobacter mediterraneus]MBM1642314.1 hypothetical protein [Sulfitobacter mediterraneus]MBM1646363.1 hypothetical protein [Sulfitobacter mediterraneus]MBM1650409.1 hypothetical protein [Sulfitobacter mediterraneus]MBM1654431.1 hypothetical protein [Sulfitobacter mediterraneus]